MAGLALRVHSHSKTVPNLTVHSKATNTDMVATRYLDKPQTIEIAKIKVRFCESLGPGVSSAMKKKDPPQRSDGPCGLMDKALDSDSKDCVFKSRLGRKQRTLQLAVGIEFLSIKPRALSFLRSSCFL